VKVSRFRVASEAALGAHGFVAKAAVHCFFVAALLLRWHSVTAGTPQPEIQERMVEWTIESTKRYADPFNDVEVDVIFAKDGQSWRVPTFWRGGQRWTVRFAPPSPGEYTYRLQSTDRHNPDLNGREGKVRVRSYAGPSELLRHGMLRISSNRRHFEYADGVPFYWLGDTWWTGLSDRLSWQGFQRLAADRKEKGFTVIQIVAGLVPYEELAPSDAGFRNEGGAVWEPGFARINPRYFDFADRRIFHLLDEGLTPAIVGSWGDILRFAGPAKLKQHWRYVIARYGAYPVFWILGGEVLDPPAELTTQLPTSMQPLVEHEWTDIAAYIRSIDPYRHPLTTHQYSPPLNLPFRGESLLDFDMVQSGHRGWPSIGAQVAQLNMHYARSSFTRPVVQGEIGYEKLGETHFEDFQRTAFWLSMLNGAAGHTYGANGTFEAYGADKPLHRVRWSFLSWEEGMNLPGSFQVGLGAKLLREYQWWRIEPHPEWVTPRGTTLLEPRTQVSDFDLRVMDESRFSDPDYVEWFEANYPGGAWKERNGDFRRPYAAGVPGELRLIYIPYFGLLPRTPPTILGLEPNARYHAFLWEPSLGTRIDLGLVERPSPGEPLVTDRFDSESTIAWREHGKGALARKGGTAAAQGEVLAAVLGAKETDSVVSVSALSSLSAGLTLRFRDADNYIAIHYSSKDKLLYLVSREKGVEGRLLGKTHVPQIGARITLSGEVRAGKAAGSITDGERTYTTPIVDIPDVQPGVAGILYRGDETQHFDDFTWRRSPALAREHSLQRRIYDSQGEHRGDLVGDGVDLQYTQVPGWDSFGRDKNILLDAYRPERMPTSGDWLLVLEGKDSRRESGVNVTSR
jgi:hypothetical protein